MPCKHHTEDTLFQFKEDKKRQEINAEMTKKNTSKDSIRNKMNRTNYFNSYNQIRMLSPENSSRNTEMVGNKSAINRYQSNPRTPAYNARTKRFMSRRNQRSKKSNNSK